MSSSSLSELRDGAGAWRRFYRGVARGQAGRRTVLRAGTLLAIAGSGSLSAVLAACSGGSKKESRSGAHGTTAAGSKGITGDWDTTGTPPYTQGLPDEVAKVPEQWKQYPWVYKYGP